MMIMNFMELVQKVRDRFSETDVSSVQGVVAYQFNITGKANGTFYIEIKDGRLSVEPYEYYDRNAIFTLSGTNLVKLIEGKLDPVVAFTAGKLKVDGDINKALEFTKFLKQ